MTLTLSTPETLLGAHVHAQAPVRRRFCGRCHAAPDALNMRTAQCSMAIERPRTLRAAVSRCRPDADPLIYAFRAELVLG